MMTTEFTPARVDAIGRALSDYISKHPHRRHRKTWTAGLLLTGAVAGAGVSAGAFAATGVLGADVPPLTAETAATEPALALSLPDPVSAPAGVAPGAPVISALNEPVSSAIGSNTSVALVDRPEDATHARVIITPTSPGSIEWGTNPDGNNFTASWTPADLKNGSSAPSWFDFPLDDTVEELYLEPSGLTGVVTVQFVAYVPTLLGVNANGQTYGVGGTAEGEPDLISVQASNGEFGYVYRDELSQATGQSASEQRTDPADALDRQERRPDTATMLDVYLADGTTKVGEFEVAGEPQD